MIPYIKYIEDITQFVVTISVSSSDFNSSFHEIVTSSLIYGSVCARALPAVTLRSHKSPGLVNYAYYSYFGMFNCRAHAQTSLEDAIGIFKYPHQLLFILQWKLNPFNYYVSYYLKFIWQLI